MTTIERVLLLQNVELFAGVTTEQLSFIATIAEEISADPGALLYNEGDAATGLYVVIAGMIAIGRGKDTIERIGPNGSFGVWALFDDEARLTRAEATESSRLLFVPREEFYDVLSDHVEITQTIFKQLVQRIRKLATFIEK